MPASAAPASSRAPAAPAPGARRSLWEATIEDLFSRERRSVRARGLVNAAGPWVAGFIDSALGLKRRQGLRLIKGSHIVVRRLFDGPQAYILQNDDRRIVFAIPYERDFTLIGTTDLPYDGDPANVQISSDEIDYLCQVINSHFVPQIKPADVVWTYAGVRPLYDDESANASAVTRDYVLELDEADGGAPLLSVFGGKITTYRKLAEHALEKLKPHFTRSGPAWTHAAPLPGGDMPDADFDAFLAGLRARWSVVAGRLGAPLCERLRHARRPPAGRRQRHQRPRAAFRRRPLRAARSSISSTRNGP